MDRCDVDTTTDGLFQRVFTWRWTAPDNQQVFELDFAELERVWTEQREALRDELDADHDLEGPSPPQLDIPYPGLGQRGGRYVDKNDKVRQPPQLELLARCAPPQLTRIEALETGFEDVSSEELARRLHFVFQHRGRPKGLSPADYGAQREWTVARSLTWSFFESCSEIPGVPVAWREMFGDAAQVLALALWARRLGRVGFTLSGPQGCTVLDTSIASWWRWVQTLERAGYLIRLRRWKPGKVGPVASTSNWYGLGPKALADLERLADPKPVMRRGRQRLRRQHRRAEGRRRGLDLLPGYKFPSLAAFVGLTLSAYQAAQTRDAQRWADFQAGIPPSDFTTASAPTFIIPLEELDQLRRLGSIVDAEPAEAVELATRENFVGVLEEVIADQGVDEVLEPLAETRSDGREVAPVRGLVIGAEEQVTGQLEPGLARRTRERRRVHRRGVVRPPGPITPPGQKAFEARCATSQSGGVGAVTGRDTRERSSEIPISQRIGAPERREKNLRTGPPSGASGPPQPPREPADRPATGSGPPGEPGSTAATVLSGVMDPRLREMCAKLGRVLGVIE